jgi:hypothetical protein
VKRTERNAIAVGCDEEYGENRQNYRVYEGYVRGRTEITENLL